MAGRGSSASTTPPVSGGGRQASGTGAPLNVVVHEIGRRKTVSVIPPVDFGVVEKSILDEAVSGSKPEQLQVTAAAANEPLRFAYGRNRVGALFLKPVVWVGIDLLLPFIIARGQIDGINVIEIDGNPITGIAYYPTIYTGTASQGVDPWLQSAWAQQAPYGGTNANYTDTMPGVAYGVLRVPPDARLNLGSLTIDFRGLRLYDPRLDSTNGGTGAQRLADPATWVYSTNPVLALCDFLKSTAYGKGETMDWTTVAAVADAADALVGGKKRRELGLCFGSQQSLDTIEEVLRTYAGCFVVREGGLVRLVADGVAASVYAFTNVAGSANYLADSLRLSVRGRKDAPTVVTVNYTDTTVKPWRTLPITEPLPGAGVSIVVPWREQVIDLPGIQDASQARREAIRRLNEYVVADLEATLTATDEAIALRRGEVVTVTDSDGLTAKPFRIMDIRPRSDPGRWAVALREYDPILYSDAVATGGSIADTTFPLPTNPPAVTGVGATEEFPRDQTGIVRSIFRIRWTAPAWPFVSSVLVNVSQGGAIVHSGMAPAGTVEYATPYLAENLQYVISCTIISTTGNRGPAGPTSSTTVTNNGKSAKPTDVSSLTGYEISGEVRLTIVPAVDLDLTAHEYRAAAAYFGAAADAASLRNQWDTIGVAALLDRVSAPAVTFATKRLAAGNWRLYVKGLDSVRSATYPYGQESVTPAYLDLVVTSDANAYLAADYSFTSAVLQWMDAIVPATGTPYWITNYGYGSTWGSLFPAAMSTYTNAVGSYFGGGTSGLWTDPKDFGATITGDWTAQLPRVDLAGTSQAFLNLSTGPEASKAITGATNSNPIIITCTGHGYTTNDEVVIASVTGNTAANGRFKINVSDADHFDLKSLNGIFAVVGNDAYTGGGTVSRWLWTEIAGLTAKATARYARLRLTTTGAVMATSLGQVKCNVISRPDGGFVTTLASGPKWVRFTRPFNKLTSLSINAINAAGTAYADKIEVSGGRGVQNASDPTQNNALRLIAASSQYVNVADATAIRLGTGNMTAECVFLATPGAGGLRMFRKDTESASGSGWGLNVVSGTYALRAGYTNSAGTNYTIDSPYAINDGQLHHAAFTVSGTTLSLLLDGVVIGQVTGMTLATTAPTGRFAIGALFSAAFPSGSFFFDGLLQEVRLWNVARTPAQIQAAMASRLVGNESGLVGYWKLMETSGTSAADSQTNNTANNGTLVNTPSWRPLDGFDAYRLNTSGSQVAGDASWSATGV